MGIAKSTNTEQQSSSQEKQIFTSAGISSIPTVNLEILRFFDVPYNEVCKGNNEEELKEIEKWAFKEETLGDGLEKLRKLEIQLGYPTGRDTRFNKIYRWIKMEKAIDDLKARQRSL